MSLKDDILARSDLAAAVAARDLDAIATGFSASRTKSVRVPIEDIQARLQSTGEWWVIKAQAAAGNQAAAAVVDVASARYSNIDFSLPIVQQQFSALVTAGFMSQSTLDDLNAMATAADPISRSDVEAALYNPDGTAK